MAGTSDKARFYLENSVAELNELERKKIFTREEIVSIARKRSDFEHVVNARGSHPSDYIRYIEFEKNVDALRRKRIKRLGVKSAGSGARTVFFLYNRGVRKFGGDLDLWMQYIEFARKEKAFKKLNEIFTAVVRLHPTKPGLWIYAARYFMETQADATSARSYMQRGLRFNKGEQKLWLEYAKLETIYIAKIAARRKILGLDEDRSKAATETETDDMIALPSVTAEDINPTLGDDDDANGESLQHLADAPVLTGAIPIAIFDAAMKQFGDSPLLAERFFAMFAEFETLPCLQRILAHIMEHLQKTSAATASTAVCEARLRLLGVHATSPAFPGAFRESMTLLDAAMQEHTDATARLAETAIRLILPALRTAEEEDETALRKVLASSLKKYSRVLEDKKRISETEGDAIANLVHSLREEAKYADAKRLVQASLKQYGAHPRIAQLQKALES